MADRTSSARINPARRKAASAGQLSMGSSPAPSGSSTPLSTQPRLKAHINPANIIGGSPSPAVVSSSRPGAVRVPSNASVRADAPARSTPRSEVGGPSVVRASPALGQRPLVARAGSGARATPPAQRSGASLPGSTLPSGASTPTGVHIRRPSSVLGSNTTSSSTPLSRSPQPDQGAFNASTGSRFRAALAGAGANDSEAPSNARPVHVRSASFTPGPRSDSSNSQLSTNSRTLSRQASGQSSPPRPTVSRNTSAGSAAVPRRRSNESSPRLPPTGAGTPPSSHSPSSSTDIPRMAMRQATEPRLSALAEVTLSSENLTQHLAPATSTQISSSLLSPSTLTPRALPSPPTIEEGALNGHESELEPSSNHSSPVRPSLQLASPSTALHAHLAHLGLGSLATASAPTSPRGGNGSLGLERKRAPLPWNPAQGAPPSFPAPPDSPELRTVALPIMTPARTPEPSEHRSLKPASFASRRFSSGSESGQGETSAVGLRKTMSARARVSPEAVMPWSDAPNGKPRKLSSAAGRWESTGDESGYGDHSDDHHTDDDIDLETEIDGNQLELTPSAEMELERDKWERKIADLEISNSSLMKINRILETTKVKQQGEIVRLRRALRDARSGVPERPVLERAPSSTAEEDPDSSGSWGDDEMEDPELEKRWDQLRDLVGAMRKAGEDAVERGRQEVKPHQRVLGWLEVEAMGMGRGDDTTGAQSEADPAETVSGATETTDDYTHTDATDAMSERSEAAPTEIGLVARVRRFN